MNHETVIIPSLIVSFVNYWGLTANGSDSMTSTVDAGGKNWQQGIFYMHIM